MTSTSHLSRLASEIALALPMQARSIGDAVAALDPAEAAELEAYLAYAATRGWDTRRLAAAYATISQDTLREQIHFQRHGRYRHDSFASVADAVYFDPDYMSRYMYGLALTLYLWPNHLALLRYFKQVFPRDRRGRYLEVGPGHGAFFRHAVVHGAFDECLGVDISPTSLAMCRDLLEATGVARHRWSLREADFLQADGLAGPFDAIVMGEVLEHVEQPGRFLSRLRALAAPDAFLWVSTAINAPAVDHIHLFRSVGEVTSLAEASGLRVVDVLATPYPGCSMQETDARRLPINIAMVLAP